LGKLLSNAGEPSQTESISHHNWPKVEIALPAVLNQDCIHVAEVSFTDSTIRYREILSRDEALHREHLLLFPAAESYASSHWSDSLRRFKHLHIKQKRDGNGVCTWSVVDQSGNTVMRTRHTSEFMELARESVVTYDE
jgi:hypothetical protein